MLKYWIDKHSFHAVFLVFLLVKQCIHILRYNYLGKIYIHTLIDCNVIVLSKEKQHIKKKKLIVYIVLKGTVPRNALIGINAAVLILAV